MRSKKGISPLIATVLLIAFAVALGAMIMNWSTETQPPTDDNGATTPQDPCSQVRLQLNQAFGKQLFCYQDGLIKFTVMNTGTKEILGIQSRTIDTNMQETKQDIPGSRMPVGDTFSGELAMAYQGKLHVEIIPFVIEDNQPKYCINQRIVQDILPNCSNE